MYWWVGQRYHVAENDLEQVINYYTQIFRNLLCGNLNVKSVFSLADGLGPGPGSSEKAIPRILKKAGPIPNFTVWVKNSFLTNLRVLISSPKKKYVNWES